MERSPVTSWSAAAGDVFQPTSRAACMLGCATLHVVLFLAASSALSRRAVLRKWTQGSLLGEGDPTEDSIQLARPADLEAQILGLADDYDHQASQSATLGPRRALTRSRSLMDEPLRSWHPPVEHQAPDMPPLARRSGDALPCHSDTQFGSYFLRATHCCLVNAFASSTSLLLVSFLAVHCSHATAACISLIWRIELATVLILAYGVVPGLLLVTLLRFRASGGLQNWMFAVACVGGAVVFPVILASRVIDVPALTMTPRHLLERLALMGVLEVNFLAAAGSVFYAAKGLAVLAPAGGNSRARHELAERLASLKERLHDTQRNIRAYQQSALNDEQTRRGARFFVSIFKSPVQFFLQDTPALKLEAENSIASTLQLTIGAVTRDLELANQLEIEQRELKTLRGKIRLGLAGGVAVFCIVKLLLCIWGLARSPSDQSGGISSDQIIAFISSRRRHPIPSWIVIALEYAPSVVLGTVLALTVWSVLERLTMSVQFLGAGSLRLSPSTTNLLLAQVMIFYLVGWLLVGGPTSAISMKCRSILHSLDGLDSFLHTKLLQRIGDFTFIASTGFSIVLLIVPLLHRRWQFSKKSL